MSAFEFAQRIPYQEGRTRAQFVAQLRRALRAARVPYGNATYDDAGNCRVCGEAGRCPGAHTLDELKKNS